MKKMILALSAILIVMVTYAQQPQKRGGKGHPGKGKYEQGMQRKGGDPDQALKQLDLNETQKQQMKALNEDFRTKMQQLNRNENITVKEQREQRTALTKAHREQIHNLLTPAQRQQMEANRKQQIEKGKGMQTERMDKMAEHLNLTPQQQSAFKAQQEKNRKAMQAIQENDKLDRNAKMEQMKALQEENRAQMSKILTKEQQDKMQEMQKKGHRGSHGPNGGKHQKINR